MMRWLALCLTMALPAFAEAPTQTIRPEGRISSSSPSVASTVLRPQARAPEQVELSSLWMLLGPTVRPLARTQNRADWALQRELTTILGITATSPSAVARTVRPDLRPAAFVRRAEEARAARLRGQVCGDPAIQGDAIGRVNGRGACGVESAVRVRSIAGVALSPRATIDCRTAGALKNWVERSAKPAVGNLGGGISSLRVVSHYACRNRNSAASGRLSEHAFGRAIDIAGIGLKDGTEITVLTDWKRGARGSALRKMWRGACGPFGTVLGPEANRFHLDHFHFDTARYRSGSYCR